MFNMNVYLASVGLIYVGLLISCQNSGDSNLQNQSISYGPGDVVTKMYLDSSGDLWIATTFEGIFRFNGRKFKNYTTEDGLCGNEVWAILEDDDGIMWFGTETGLCRWDGKGFKNIPLPENDPNDVSPDTGYPSRGANGVAALIQDSKGTYWIGTDGNGAFSYDGETFKSYLKFKGRLQPDSVYSNSITNIVEDYKGHIWFGSFTHGGLEEYDGKNFTNHALADGLGDGMVNSSFSDSEGYLWFGTRNGGLYSYNFDVFYKMKNLADSSEVAMATVFEDSNGRFWVGSYARKGVLLHDNSYYSPFEIENSDKLVDVKCIAEDKDGHIWFGGRYGLLWSYDGNKLIDYTTRKRN